MHMQKENGSQPFIASAMACGDMHFVFREGRRGKMGGEEQRHHRRRSGLHRQTASDYMSFVEDTLEAVLAILARDPTMKKSEAFMRIAE